MNEARTRAAMLIGGITLGAAFALPIPQPIAQPDPPTYADTAAARAAKEGM